MPKGTFKTYLLYGMFTHEKAGFPQTNEESPPFFVYRIKSKFSVKRRNPNPSPTWKIKFGFPSFGPSGESRTHGLLNPIQARYQTALHPDVFPVAHWRRCLLYVLLRLMSTLFSKKNFQNHTFYYLMVLCTISFLLLAYFCLFLFLVSALWSSFYVFRLETLTSSNTLG